MKTHTSNFKNNLIKFGRELDSKITYTQNGTQVELGSEELNSITPHYEGSILKSVMKQLDIDSNVEIPLKTILTYHFGVKVNGEYEYISYGNYIVNKVEKCEDTNSWLITCYDKMLYAMKDYDNNGITYPLTVRNYINAICNKIGLTFANSSSIFVNYNKQISTEYFLDTDGNSMSYTFRDVFDQLAEVTASTICINEETDELEIRYINDTDDTIDEEFLKDVNVNFGKKFGPVNTIVLSRSAGSDSIHYPSTLPTNPIEIVIEDNLIMNGNDRDTFMPDIYNKLNGLEYYMNDYSSFGICYYNLCDKYNVKVGNNIYPCIMLNDEVNITQGLEEMVYTDESKQEKPDYKNTSATDKAITQANIIVKKNEAQILEFTQALDAANNRLNSVEQKQTATDLTIDIISTNIDKTNGEVRAVTTNTGFTFDENGLNIKKSDTDYNTLIDNTGTYYKDGETIISMTNKDGFLAKDFRLQGQHYYSYNASNPSEPLASENYDFVDERIEIEVDGQTQYAYATFYNGEV